MPIAPTYPGLTTAQDTVVGPGLTILFYGLPPGSALTYTIASGGARGSATVMVSPYGTYTTYLGNDWAAGPYTISGSWSGGVLTTNAVKPAATAISFVP